MIMGLATPTRQEPLKIQKGPDTILAWIGRGGSAALPRRDSAHKTQSKGNDPGGEGWMPSRRGQRVHYRAAPQVDPTAVQPGETASGNSRVVGEDGVSKRLQCLLILYIFGVCPIS